MRLLIACIALALPATAAADDGPWAQEPGGHYVRLASRIVVGSLGYMADGSLLDVRETYIDTDLGLYAEYGVDERLTVIGSAGAIGYVTIGPRASTSIGPLRLAARLTLPRVNAQLEGLQLAFELHASLNPGFGSRRVGAALIGTRIWEYAPSYEHHQFGAALRLGYQLGWGTYLLLDAGICHRNRPEALGAIFYGSAAFGLESELGVDLNVALRWLQPTGEVKRHNFSGASGSRYLGASVTLTLWLSDAFGLYLGVEGHFLAQASRPGPFILSGLVHRGE